MLSLQGILEITRHIQDFHAYNDQFNYGKYIFLILLNMSCNSKTPFL